MDDRTCVPRDATVAVLGVVAFVGLAVGLAGLAVNRWLAVIGFAPGSVALAVAACSGLLHSRGRAAFPIAFLAVLTASLVTLAVAAGFSAAGVFGWTAMAAFVFPFGIGLSYALGVARTARQRWIVVAALSVLGELFVAAAVLDSNTHWETEGIATLFGVAFIPVAALLALPLYYVGASTRDGSHDEALSRRPLVAVAAVILAVATTALLV